MKTKIVFLDSFFLIFMLPALLIGQDISVHKFMGKTNADVITKYGNPVHQDFSNPDMNCMFYQTKTNRMIFVAGKEGIYQSEATVTYDSETKARNVFSEFISESRADGFETDSISANVFQLNKTGVKVDIQLFENKITKTFDVSVKAHK